MTMAAVKKKTICKNCGKELDNGKDYCNQKCYLDFIKQNGKKGKSEELYKLSNKNKCYKCGKELPPDWISAYCTACENEWDV